MTEELQELIEAQGPYRIEFEIGEGGSAWAFKAHHSVLNRDVFIKLYGVDSQFPILNEPQYLVEALKAPESRDCLVEIHHAELIKSDSPHLKTYLLMVLGFVEGESVGGLLKTGPPSLHDAIDITVGILNGTVNLHSNFLLHRDLKPGNVMLQRLSNGAYKALITDFGSVAKFSSEAPRVCGSRHSDLYVPPESWSDPSLYDTRSDLYQIGVIFSELVYGQLPQNSIEYLDKPAIKRLGDRKLTDLHPADAGILVKESFARLTAKNCGILKFHEDQPHIPLRIKRFMRKALQSDPSNRFQSAGEMLCALSSVEVPNWRVLSNQDFSSWAADGWKGWDWKISSHDKKFVITRKKANASRYQKYGQLLKKAETAFRQVNAF